MKNQIMSCEFNIDTACVEVKSIDCSVVSIDCIAVENEFARNIYEVSGMNYLIFSEPLSYVRLLLCGKIHCVDAVKKHRLCSMPGHAQKRAFQYIMVHCVYNKTDVKTKATLSVKLNGTLRVKKRNFGCIHFCNKMLFALNNS